MPDIKLRFLVEEGQLKKLVSTVSGLSSSMKALKKDVESINMTMRTYTSLVGLQNNLTKSMSREMAKVTSSMNKTNKAAAALIKKQKELSKSIKLATDNSKGAANGLKQLEDKSKKAEITLGSLETAVKGFIAVRLAQWLFDVAAGFKDIVLEGADAAMAFEAWGRRTDDVTRRMKELKASTAGLIEETELSQMDNMGKQAELTMEQIDRMMQMATKASVDTDKGIKEVFQQLMIGEAESLRALGVFMETEEVLFRAGAKRLGVEVEDLSAKQEQLIKRNEILAQTSMLDLSVSMENSGIKTKQAAIEFTDLISQLKVLAVEMLVDTGIVDGMKEAIREISKWFKENETQIRSLSRVMKKVLKAVITENVDAINGLSAAWIRSQEAVKKVAIATEQVSLRIQIFVAEIQTAATGIQDSMTDMFKEVLFAIGSLIDNLGGSGDAVREWGNELVNISQKQVKDSEKIVKDLSTELDVLQEEYINVGVEANKAIRGIFAVSGAAESATETVSDLARQFEFVFGMLEVADRTIENLEAKKKKKKEKKGKKKDSPHDAAAKLLAAEKRRLEVQFNLADARNAETSAIAVQEVLSRGMVESAKELALERAKYLSGQTVLDELNAVYNRQQKMKKETSVLEMLLFGGNSEDSMTTVEHFELAISRAMNSTSEGMAAMAEANDANIAKNREMAEVGLSAFTEMGLASRETISGIVDDIGVLSDAFASSEAASAAGIHMSAKAIGGIAKLGIKDKKALAIVTGTEELALAASAFATGLIPGNQIDLVRGGLHLVASVKHFATAATGGGGSGGGGRGGSSGGGGRGRAAATDISKQLELFNKRQGQDPRSKIFGRLGSDAPGTIVMNFNSLSPKADFDHAMDVLNKGARANTGRKFDSRVIPSNSNFTGN